MMNYDEPGQRTTPIQEPLDPITVLHSLDAHARELDEISKILATVELELTPVTRQYEAFMADYDQGLWEQHVDGAKLPSEALRARMAHRAMNPELLGHYLGLVSTRKRLEKRISSLKAIVDAKRSILSALKTELEAGGGNLRGGS